MARAHLSAPSFRRCVGLSAGVFWLGLGCVNGSPAEPEMFKCVDKKAWYSVHVKRGEWIVVRDSVTVKPCPLVRPLRREHD